MTTSRVAILLATFNGERWLNDQLNSILFQRNCDWRLFFRDDGSTDTTIAIIEDFVRSTNRGVLISSPEGPTGTAAANFLIALRSVELDQYEYVCFSDQDDIWAPDKISHAIRCLYESGAAGYSSDLVAFDNRNNSAWYLQKSGTQVTYDYLFQGASAGCTYVLTRQAAKLVVDRTRHLLPSDFKDRSHDWLIYAICRSFGLHWFMDSSAHIFYRQHSANVFGALPATPGLYARLRLARTGWYRDHVIWLEPLLSGGVAEKVVFNAVKRAQFIDRVWLVKHVAQFRREFRDRVLLALVLLLGWF